MRKRCGLLVILILAVVFPAAAQDNQQPSLPGYIAYIGLDQNVYTLNLSDNTEVALTADASRTHVYRWPTWSNDGRLAYFMSSPQETEVRISPDGQTPGEAVYAGEGEVFNYAYWSPANCVASDRCRDLAVLLSSRAAGGLFVELVRDGLETASSRTAGEGGPFYFSWSPDGGRMLWQRNNERLDIFDAETNNLLETLSVTPGMFQAPGWSPVDDRLLVGALNRDGVTTDVVIATSEGQRVLASRLEGPVAFAWSPNGDYVAYTNRDGPLTVLDALTGRLIVRSSVTGVAAFFWSPDSQHIAYITLSTPPSSFSVQADGRGKVAAAVQEPTGIAWSVLDVNTGATRRYGAFVPTQDMLYLLVYFDQFAQSHRLWSPDSRYLIYAEVTPADEAVISLLDTTQSNAVPFSLANGYIGIWSFK
ncbi:MAG: PD40 domain-containing protein [Chloroflexi bacterium]|nr:PD40 domain-containing protein [Chloroflexota bacterium]